MRVLFTRRGMLVPIITVFTPYVFTLLMLPLVLLVSPSGYAYLYHLKAIPTLPFHP